MNLKLIMAVGSLVLLLGLGACNRGGDQGTQGGETQQEQAPTGGSTDQSGSGTSNQ